MGGEIKYLEREMRRLMLEPPACLLLVFLLPLLVLILLLLVLLLLLLGGGGGGGRGGDSCEADSVWGLMNQRAIVWAVVVHVRRIHVRD